MLFGGVVNAVVWLNEDLLISGGNRKKPGEEYGSQQKALLRGAIILRLKKGKLAMIRHGHKKIMPSAKAMNEVHLCQSRKV